MTQQIQPPAGMPTPPPYGAPRGSWPEAQSHGAPPGYGMPVAAPRTNGLAIGALVAAFIAPLIGLILGIVARKQIARSGEGGRGLATAAIWLGAIFTAIGVASVIAVLALATTVTVTTPSTPAAPSAAQSAPSAPSASSSAPTYSTTLTVSGDDVATEIATQAGLPAGSVSCPAGDVEGKVGNSVTCTATTANGPTTIVATVSSIEGTTVNFDFREQ